jgi:biotin operon repressor
MTPIDRVLGLLEKARQTGEGYTAQCPTHDDRDPSLSIRTGVEGKVLMKCHAGCATPDVLKAIGLSMTDLFPGGGRRVSSQPETGETGQPPGLTAEQYGADKGLPTEFLAQIGVSTVPNYLGAPAVRILYYAEDGEEYRVRFRLAASGPNKFRWRKDDAGPLIPYGVWRLEQLRHTSEYLVIVEGESDAQTLWHHDVPALGLPGASTWKPEWEKYLEGFETIYLFVEPDRGGETLVKSLAESSVKDRVMLIRPEETAYKDPSDMHIADTNTFKARFRSLLDNAESITDIEADRTTKLKVTVAAQCRPILDSTDILSLFYQALSDLGVAGEKSAAKLLYLVFTSRLLPELVSAIVTGPSSSGKSFLVEQVLRFFSDVAYFQLTAMSDRFLAHFDESMSHRHLVIAEAAGARSEDADYMIRSLLSEGRIKYGVVQKGEDGTMKSVIKLLEGPTGLVMTTTSSRIHPENATRLLEIPVTDTPEQTRAVNMLTARKHSGEPGGQTDLAPWVAFHEYLAIGPVDAVVPFALTVGGLTSVKAVRMRRSLTAVFLLVKAHALLHQENRERDVQGRIVANLTDYQAVRGLVLDIIGEAVSSSVSPTIRATVLAVKAIQNSSTGKPVSGKELADYLGLDPSAVSKRVGKAKALGYLINQETGRGRRQQLVVGDPMPEDQAVLPSVSDVARASRSGETVSLPERDLHDTLVVPITAGEDA